MKRHCLLCCLAAVFVVASFVARTYGAQPLIADPVDDDNQDNVVRARLHIKPYTDFLDETSQSNTVVGIQVDPPRLCPLTHTNVLSNTNLFTRRERELILAIPGKYERVTTNSGPPGTVLVGLARAVFHWDGYDRESVLAHFAYTNSAATEEIAFFPTGRKTVKCQTKPGYGYYANLYRDGLVAYNEFKDGKLDGLFTELCGDHCGLWLRFSKGKAVGKFLMWAPRELNPFSWGLEVEVEFKQPYDFLKYQQMQFDLTWVDSPRIITDASSPAEGTQPRR